jgi:hypothetical protein
MSPEKNTDAVPPEPPWTVEAFSDWSDTDRKTIYGGIARGEIPAVQIGRRLLIPAAWIRKSFGNAS